MNEGYGSMPVSLLVEEQGLDPPFTPSSPSLDMEAALHHLSSSSCDSELRSKPSSLDDTDVLMVDPFLDYLNEVLMEEGEQEYVPCKQHDVEAAYLAIVSSLYDIVGERLPLNSTSSKEICAFNRSQGYQNHESVSGFVSGSHSSNPWDYKKSPHELHDDKGYPYSGGLKQHAPVCGDFDVSLKQEQAGNLCEKHAFLGSHNGPVDAARVHDCAVTGSVSEFSFNNGGKQQDRQQTSSFDFSQSDSKSMVKPSSNIDISFEEFKDTTGYTHLYLGKLSLSDTPSTGKAGSRDKKKSPRAARQGSQSLKKGTGEVVGFVDVRELLVSCAQAVAMGDFKKAREIMQEVYQDHGASVTGNGLQRVAHHFCVALVARMGGMGWHQYKLMGENLPSAVPFLRASRAWYVATPYMKMMHYFANQNILKVAEGASRLHILDYGIEYGMQWPCLINALADRDGGPPLLVITGIDCPRPGQNSLQWLEESGYRLAVYAETYHVSFEFHAIVSDHWEDLDPASFHVQEDEVLVVNCMKRLCEHADESVDTTSTISPRQKLLMSMRSLNPNLLLMAEINTAGNSPFFVSRFREVLYCCSNIVDMLDTVWGVGDPDMLFIETRCHARGILNIVACEGAERVERPEAFKQWDARIKSTGFRLMPIPAFILSRSTSYVKQYYHKYFFVDEDGNGWMLLGWKGRAILAMSAWKPGFSKQCPD